MNARRWVKMFLLLLIGWQPLEAAKLRDEWLSQVSLNQLTSFDFEASRRTGSDLLTRFPEARIWVEEAVEGSLREHGIVRAAGEPDLLVTIWVTSRQGARKITTSRLTDSFVEEFIEATLVVEFFTAGASDPFWRGLASEEAPLTRKGPRIKATTAERKARRIAARLIQRFFRKSRQ